MKPPEPVAVQWGIDGTSLIILQGRYAITVPLEEIKEFAAKVQSKADQVKLCRWRCTTT